MTRLSLATSLISLLQALNLFAAAATYNSTNIIDPEYNRSRLIPSIEKSDVYSFGVVMFEVLCGKPPVFQGLSEEKVSLAQWAHNCYKKESLDEIVDPYLTGQITPIALQKFGEVAENCAREQGNERPTMWDIVGASELTLQLQESVEENTNSGDAIITNKFVQVRTQ
ncbi:hypothetical protein SLEP1_g57248 [Rubroshorea leprosula]|uniref:Protein kinase domain-containing protein n=1 Tax=Rubroshorea leprosula TaxID=152421 RepID=A0AAV5MP77_9ROSI|nr:hypothetical protein SLEP1_g57248 [Rubroshorea leprosula]